MVSWNHEVDAKLFVCCLKQLTSTLNYQQLATDMATFDIGSSQLPAFTRIHTLDPSASPQPHLHVFHLSLLPFSNAALP